jgi:hypothetical protein
MGLGSWGHHQSPDLATVDRPGLIRTLERRVRRAATCRRPADGGRPGKAWLHADIACEAEVEPCTLPLLAGENLGFECISRLVRGSRRCLGVLQRGSTAR